MLILHLLTEQDQYGYQLQNDLSERTDGLFTLTPASLYGPLYRLLAKGYVTEKQVSVGVRRQRTYYHLTEDGLEYYRLMVQEYRRTHLQVVRLMGLDIYEGEEKGHRGCI